MKSPKLVYFGTPALAVPPLEALLTSGKYEIAAVITQTDKPAGRGNNLTPSPVKVFALENDIPVFQPRLLKGFSSEGSLSADAPNKDLADFLRGAGPIDAFIVAAYGKIIPKALIDFPRCGIVNIHLSLLPRWRGAAPIQRALLAGDAVTGISIMQIDEGLDTGPVFAMREVIISDDDDAGSLTDKLSNTGSALLLETLPGILDGIIRAKPQPTGCATYAEKLQKSDFRIDWRMKAREIRRIVLAGSPAPGATAEFEGSPVKLFRIHEVAADGLRKGKPGEVLESTKASLIVAAGDNTCLAIDELQFPGKKRLPILEVLRGKIFPQGARFT